MAKNKTNKIDNTQTTIDNFQFAQINLPTHTERVYGEWVRYGDDNNFPQFLQSLSEKSALHNAIISSKVDYAYADGLKLDDTAGVDIKLFFEHPNPEETLNDIYYKSLIDYIFYGGIALEVIWSKDKEVPAEINHIPFDKIRCKKKDAKGNVKEYLYCDDWTKYRTIGIATIPAFDPSNRVGNQLLYVKEYRPGSTYYPLPQYIGAINYIAIDAEISNFHLSHIINGMNPSLMISFCNGVPTDEERAEIKRKLLREYTGTDNTGNIILTFSDNLDQIPKVQPISQDNLDQQFIQLSATVLQNILSGHKVVSPMLVGIKESGQLGGASELSSAYKIYTSNVIKPLQTVTINALHRLLLYISPEYKLITPTEKIINFE